MLFASFLSNSLIILPSVPITWWRTGRRTGSPSTECYFIFTEISFDTLGSCSSSVQVCDNTDIRHQVVVPLISLAFLQFLLWVYIHQSQFHVSTWQLLWRTLNFQNPNWDNFYNKCISIDNPYFFNSPKPLKVFLQILLICRLGKTTYIDLWLWHQ